MPLNILKTVPSRLAPLVPREIKARFSKIDTDVPMRALHAALTPRGISLAVGTSLGDFIMMAPYTVLPRLAPLCLTPGAQLALVGSYVGIELVAKPMVDVGTRWLQQRFDNHYTMKLQDGWMTAASNKAKLWRNTELSQACEQQLLDATREEASLMGLLIRSAMGSLTGLFTGLYGLRSLTMMTGASLCLIGITSLLPIAAATLTQRYKTAAQTRLVDARQALMQSVKGFWDNTTIGDTARRESWSASHKRATERCYAQAWHTERLEYVCSEFERFPQTAMQCIMVASQFSSSNFPNIPPLLSASFIKNYGSAQAFVYSLSSSTFCFDMLLRLQQKAAIRNSIEQRLLQPIDLRSQIDVTALTIHKDGVAMNAQTLLDNPSVLRDPGLYTVRGPNGAGKSTFLTHCRDILGDDVLLVPAKHNLAFNLAHGSSGQMMLATLDRLDEENPRPKVLMLDEWNANLSRDNEALMLDRLRRWSRTTSVVQVTHHD